MNCSQCTFYNEIGTIKCTICDNKLVWNINDQYFVFEDWLNGIGLGLLKDKIKEDILKEITLEHALDTSSKITRKNAIKLAHNIGIFQGKSDSKKEENISREVFSSKEKKILEDRLIIQEQDLRSEIIILQERLEEAEKKLKVFECVKNTTIEPEYIAELTHEQRRKIVADSWLKK